MHIAYLISAFADPQHLKRLIEALNAGDCEFFVHVDRKTDVLPFEELCNAANVHFLKNRVNVYWGTYSQVEFQMRMIRAALDAGRPFDRLFILSGQDYPLWSNSRISAYLKAAGEKELLSGICLDTDEVLEKKKRIYRLYRPQTDIAWLSPSMNDWLSKGIRKVCKLLGVRKELNFSVNGHTWNLYKGSDYLCLSRELAEYVYRTWNDNPSIQRYFKSSFAPSETCIQTIVFNNPLFRERADLHTGDYQSLKDLTLLHHIDYVPVIRIWKTDDFDELMQSGKMFARKFTTTESKSLLDKIDHQRNECEC